jgi:hypothetical protein
MRCVAPFPPSMKNMLIFSCFFGAGLLLSCLAKQPIRKPTCIFGERHANSLYNRRIRLRSGGCARAREALAFLMPVIALSLSEMVILRKVLKVPLLLAFAGIVGCGILVVG